MGGYFIVNGNEKVIRMLIMPRRNYPIAMARPKWKSRGQGYTQYGTNSKTSQKTVVLSLGSAVQAVYHLSLCSHRSLYALCEGGAHSHQHEPSLSGKRDCDAELHLPERALLPPTRLRTQGTVVGLMCFMTQAVFSMNQRAAEYLKTLGH